MRSHDIKRRQGLRIGRRRRKFHISLNIRQYLPRLSIPKVIGFKTLKTLTAHVHIPFYSSKRRRKRSFASTKDLFFRLCVIATILALLVFAWRVLRPGVNIRVNPNTVAAFNIPHRAIGLLESYANTHSVPFPELMVLFLAENDFFPNPSATFDFGRLETTYAVNFNRLLRRYNSRSLAPYIEMFHNLFGEIEVFPIPDGWYDHGHDATVMFGNSWGVAHNFQGNRTHMGTAIIDRENIRGRVPIVSMTAGQVTGAGWDNQLGYFVEITTINSSRYLYAHLDSIAPGLAEGQHIAAGQALGQMGNSGGGRGSRSFPVHLHLAISPDVRFTRGDFWINPYPLLRYLDSKT